MNAGTHLVTTSHQTTAREEEKDVAAVIDIVNAS
jgi:hypothetical protein